MIIRRADCARLELLSGTGCVGGGDGEKGDGLGGLSANKRVNSPNLPSRDGAIVIDRTEAAGARCFSWRAGAVAPHAASAILLARGSANPPKFAEAIGGQIVQLCATYTTASGGKRVRVTTLRLPRLPRAVPPAQLLGEISAIHLGHLPRPFTSAIYLGHSSRPFTPAIYLGHLPRPFISAIYLGPFTHQDRSTGARRRRCSLASPS